MLLGYVGRFVNANSKYNTVTIEERKKVQWEFEEGDTTSKQGNK